MMIRPAPFGALTGGSRHAGSHSPQLSQAGRISRRDGRTGRASRCRGARPVIAVTAAVTADELFESVAVPKWREGAWRQPGVDSQRAGRVRRHVADAVRDLAL